MRLSRYFLPVLRETPKEAEIVSHQLMLRAGMIRQASAGIYSWLPLGLRVLKKIEQIVREEQNRAGAIEMLMPTIQSAEIWRELGRYEAYGKEMLRIVDRHEREMLYGPTNEELITQIFRESVRSYKDLPRNLYHIQWKFRDEIRPRFGVMRGREFLMKDAYSFDLTPEAAATPTTGCSPPTCAPSRAWACSRSRWRPRPVRSAATSATSSSFWLRRAKARVYCHKDLVEGDIPPADTDFDADLTADRQGVDVALCRHRREARPGALRPRGAEGQAGDRPRHRGRSHLLLRHQVFRAHELPRAGSGRQDDARCRWAPTASACRGSSVRSSRLVTTTAGIVWPVPVAPFEVGLDQSEGRRRRNRRGLRPGSTSSSPMPGSRFFTTTPTSGRE